MIDVRLGERFRMNGESLVIKKTTSLVFDDLGESREEKVRRLARNILRVPAWLRQIVMRCYCVSINRYPEVCL